MIGSPPGVRRGQDRAGAPCRRSPRPARSPAARPRPAPRPGRGPRAGARRQRRPPTSRDRGCGALGSRSRQRHASAVTVVATQTDRDAVADAGREADQGGGDPPAVRSGVGEARRAARRRRRRRPRGPDPRRPRQPDRTRDGDHAARSAQSDARRAKAPTNTAIPASVPSTPAADGRRDQRAGERVADRPAAPHGRREPDRGERRRRRA